MIRKIVYGALGFLLGGSIGLVGATAIGIFISPTHATQTGLGAFIAPIIVAILCTILGVKFARHRDAQEQASVSKASKYGTGALIGGLALVFLGFNLSILPIAVLVFGLYAAVMSFRRERENKSYIVMAVVGLVLLIAVAGGSLMLGTSLGLEPYLFNAGA
jgi:hypothetical protein